MNRLGEEVMQEQGGQKKLAGRQVLRQYSSDLDKCNSFCGSPIKQKACALAQTHLHDTLHKKSRPLNPAHADNTVQ